MRGKSCFRVPPYKNQQPEAKILRQEDTTEHILSCCWVAMSHSGRAKELGIQQWREIPYSPFPQYIRISFITEVQDLILPLRHFFPFFLFFPPTDKAHLILTIFFLIFSYKALVPLLSFLTSSQQLPITLATIGPTKVTCVSCKSCLLYFWEMLFILGAKCPLAQGKSVGCAGRLVLEILSKLEAGAAFSPLDRSDPLCSGVGPGSCRTRMGSVASSFLKILVSGCWFLQGPSFSSTLEHI